REGGRDRGRAAGRNAGRARREALHESEGRRPRYVRGEARPARPQAPARGPERLDDPRLARSRGTRAGDGGVMLSVGDMTRLSRQCALAFTSERDIENLIHRITFNGRVTDFIYLQAGPLHTGVFNVADMAITFGVLWLLGTWAFASKEPSSS